MSIFTSGNIKTKSDCFVSYTPKNSGSLEISIQSKTDILHSEKLNEIVQKTLSDLQIKHGKFEIVDNGGQYFVL
ncbi:MAG: hypothetical protein H8E71_08185, partial [Candidatus Marinimicrobia bacterium]|nr:hypothetical protein [Candidatus Neomarinimicrobiota bacterium]